MGGRQTRKVMQMRSKRHPRGRIGGGRPSKVCRDGQGTRKSSFPPDGLSAIRVYKKLRSAGRGRIHQGGPLRYSACLVPKAGHFMIPLASRFRDESFEEGPAGVKGRVIFIRAQSLVIRNVRFLTGGINLTGRWGFSRNRTWFSRCCCFALGSAPGLGFAATGKRD